MSKKVYSLSVGYYVEYEKQIEGDMQFDLEEKNETQTLDIVSLRNNIFDNASEWYKNWDFSQSIPIMFIQYSLFDDDESVEEIDFGRQWEDLVAIIIIPIDYRHLQAEIVDEIKAICNKGIKISVTYI